MASRVFQGAEQSTARYCMLDSHSMAALARVCAGRSHEHSHSARPWAGPHGRRSWLQATVVRTTVLARVQEKLRSEAGEVD